MITHYVVFGQKKIYTPVTHYVDFCVAVFHVDLLDVLDDVVPERLTEQRVLTSEQPKEQLQ